MNRAVASATQLTRQLLAFSRRQALVPEHVRLQDRLPALAPLLTPVLGAQIELVVTVEADCRPIRVDSAELELGLINLAINARDAMPASGRFQLAARNLADAAPLLRGRAVLIEASDSGTGIERADFVRVLAARRDHDNRHARPCAHRLHHLDAVHIGQAQIEQHDARCLR